jgi:DNA modification methylase
VTNLRIINADVLAGLAQIEDATIQTVVTSPPYWGLRDYGTAKWEGGDPECDHSPERRGGRFATPVSSKQASNSGSGTASSRECPCGARRIDNQIGLERTPNEYVSRLVAVFREVRRTLRDDGTLWLNLGDSYANTGNPGQDFSASSVGYGGKGRGHLGGQPVKQMPPGLKPKDLCGIPWRVAFALQADGWYLRSDIIWAKPNPMPESVTDRPTKAHEYVFLLTKAARYYYDARAVREPNTVNPNWDYGSEQYRRQVTSDDFKVNGNSRLPKSAGAGWHGVAPSGPMGMGRNARTVWTIATEPYSGAHFATFPTALAERCIRAGSRPGDTVLDPLAGSGTALMVARGLGRHAVGIELNPDYCRLIERRCALPWEATATTDNQPQLALFCGEDHA